MDECDFSGPVESVKSHITASMDSEHQGKHGDDLFTELRRRASDRLDQAREQARELRESGIADGEELRGRLEERFGELPDDFEAARARAEEAASGLDVPGSGEESGASEPGSEEEMSGHDAGHDHESGEIEADEMEESIGGIPVPVSPNVLIGVAVLFVVYMAVIRSPSDQATEAGDEDDEDRGLTAGLSE